MILTSNVYDASLDVNASIRLLSAYLRPEFINRLDDIIVFHPLSKKDLCRIIDLQVADLSKRLESRDISLSLDAAAKELVLQEAYDPVYGARPLKRYLEKKMVTELSRLLLDGTLHDHAQVLITKADSNSAGGIVSGPYYFIITPKDMNMKD